MTRTAELVSDLINGRKGGHKLTLKEAREELHGTFGFALPRDAAELLAWWSIELQDDKDRHDRAMRKAIDSAPEVAARNKAEADRKARWEEIDRQVTAYADDLRRGDAEPF